MTTLTSFGGFRPIFTVSAPHRAELLANGLDHCDFDDGNYEKGFIVELGDFHICRMCLAVSERPGMTNNAAFDRRLKAERWARKHMRAG